MRRLFVLFVCVLLAQGCGRSEAPPPGAPPGAVRPSGPDAETKTAIADFWTWFAQAAPGIAGNPALDREIGERLRRIDKGLSHRSVVDGRDSLLVVSANGDVRLFPLVTQVVAQAPAIAGWKVVAFRQRQSPLSPVKVGAVSVAPADVTFTATPQDGRLAVDVYVRGLTADNDEEASSAALALVEQAAGEHDTFGFLTLGRVAAPNAGKAGRRIEELPAVIDAFKKQASP